MYTVTTYASMTGGRNANIEGQGFAAVMTLGRDGLSSCRYKGGKGIVALIPWSDIEARLREEMEANVNGIVE
jgi:hypothetical protein